MATAARIDRLAPDREASVRSRGIFLHVSRKEFAYEQSASFVSKGGLKREDCLVATEEKTLILYVSTSSRLQGASLPRLRSLLDFLQDLYRTNSQPCPVLHTSFRGMNRMAAEPDH